MPAVSPARLHGHAACYAAVRWLISVPPLMTERLTMWKKCIFCLAALMSVALTGCNTVQGAGQDISSAGRSISNEAQEHKHY